MLQRTLVILLILYAAISTGSTIIAQDDTVTTPNGLVIAIPEGYQAQVVEGPLVYIANSDNAMLALETGSGDMQPDDVAFTVAPPSVLEDLGLFGDIDPATAIEQMIAMLGASGDITKSSMGVGSDYPAIEHWWVEADAPALPAPITTFYAFSIDSGTVLITGQAGESVSTIALAAIMKSLVYEQPATTSELPNSYMSGDGSLHFDYPTDWVVDEDEVFITLANNEAALQASLNEELLGTDQAAILFIHPASLEQLGLSPDVDPDEVIQVFLDDIGMSADIDAYPEVSEDARRALVTSDEFDGEGLIVAIPTEAGTVLMLVETGGSLADYQDDFTRIAQSLLNPPQSSSETPDMLRQWASSATGTSQYGTDGWSFAQATGAPDTFECGDITTAWAGASATSDEILALEFDQEVIPTQVNIHQTYNPGAIVKVELSNTLTGETIEIAKSADPPGNTACPGVFTLDISDIQTPVNGVIIYLDQSITGNWNEIDAVELVGSPIE